MRLGFYYLQHGGVLLLLGMQGLSLSHALLLLRTHMLGRLGCAGPTSGNIPIGLSFVTVKIVTLLQLQSVLDAREAKHMASLLEACQGLAGPTKGHVMTFERFVALSFHILISVKSAFGGLFTVYDLPTVSRTHAYEESPCSV